MTYLSTVKMATGRWVSVIPQSFISFQTLRSKISEDNGSFKILNQRVQKMFQLQVMASSFSSPRAGSRW